MPEKTPISKEILILKNLLTNEDFTRQSIPYIKKKYFDGANSLTFSHIRKFIQKYNSIPSLESLSVEIQEKMSMDDYLELKCSVLDPIREIKHPEKNLDWLLDYTEKWCQDRALELSILDAFNILDGKKDDIPRSNIPEMLQDALSVSFDSSIGHDFIEDAKKRFESYHLKENHIPFTIKDFNEITKGGFIPKTLNVFMASTGVGKSIFMCHFAAENLLAGQDVLYITMEMSEEKIAERIDANVLDINIDEIQDIPRNVYETKIHKLKSKTNGKLVIKEFPTGGAHVGHFRSLINELKIKKKFCPKIIYIDYLNICSSSRFKGDPSQSYGLVKSIAEEIRGLAIETKTVIVSATQSNRSGFNNSDVDLDATSESWGLPATVDFQCVLIQTTEFEKLGQIKVKQLKNRYNDMSKKPFFMVGVDKTRMRVYSLENSRPENLVDASSIEGSGSFFEKSKTMKGFV